MALVLLHGRLGAGKFALVDDADLPIIAPYRWYLGPFGYAHAKPYIGNYRKASIYMARLILQTPKGFETDHINHNRLDNRRANLRVATLQQNRVNSVSRTGRLRGVQKEPHAATWRARIRVHQRTLCLGQFKTARGAALAYNAAALLHFGEFAVLNTI
jgi:hypothetical protein